MDLFLKCILFPFYFLDLAMFCLSNILESKYGLWYYQLLFRKSLCWKSLNWLDLLFHHFISLLCIRYLLFFLESFSCPSNDLFWSFRDFIESNFGCQYWSNLRVLISKIYLWYWQQYYRHNTSINSSINPIINTLSFSYFIHNRNLKIPFRMKRFTIIDFDLLDIFII